METFNIHHAKTHLSRLVEKAAQGEAFVIAKAGKPLVKVVPLEAPSPRAVRRIGFMTSPNQIPEDFDRMHATEIEGLFSGEK